MRHTKRHNWSYKYAHKIECCAGNCPLKRLLEEEILPLSLEQVRFNCIKNIDNRRADRSPKEKKSKFSSYGHFHKEGKWW